MTSKTESTLWVVTSLFFKEQCPLRTQCFYTFRDFLRNANIPLCVVEMAANDGEYLTQEGDADIVHHVRGEVAIWQKYPLLMKGVRTLPKACTEVALLDADIVFLEDDWPARIKEMLNLVPGGQVFSRFIHFGADDTVPEYAALQEESVRSLWSQRNISHGFSYGYFSVCYPTMHGLIELYGHPGFGWAYRREFLESHGLFSDLPLSGADEFITRSLYKQECMQEYESVLPEYVWQRAPLWMKTISEDFGNLRGCCNATICHLYHGDVQKRDYVSRYEESYWKRFDVEHDLHRDENGFLLFSDPDGPFATLMRRKGLRKSRLKIGLKKSYVWMRNKYALLKAYPGMKDDIVLRRIICQLLYGYFYRHRSEGLKNTTWYMVRENSQNSLLDFYLCLDLKNAKVVFKDGRESSLPRSAIRCHIASYKKQEVSQYLQDLSCQHDVYEYVILQSSGGFSEADLSLLASRKYSYEVSHFRTLRFHILFAARHPDHDTAVPDWKDSSGVFIRDLAAG